MLSTCWPESWSRRRRTHKNGGGYGMGAVVAAGGGLESMSSSGSIGLGGKGLHSSTFQLNQSRFWHKIHPTHTHTR